MKCPVYTCQKTFQKKFNLRRHLEECHHGDGAATWCVCPRPACTFQQLIDPTHFWEDHFKPSHSHHLIKHHAQHKVSPSTPPYTSVYLLSPKTHSDPVVKLDAFTRSSPPLLDLPFSSQHTPNFNSFRDVYDSLILQKLTKF
ncbi:hypothetical protein CONCODRAFT_4682 [Conidiobolus coronatus NRRL 28638]|uniref:C2H2-type domain-containing protein n=1 Tax=Conidiobolus coronatus (strain ATCC 28846 / CBS 209.66 / NRRL 28638) TaxID=796925 RepID=A0A137PBT7_CONC2|nr:hypothetical protein CONCODRAFT_4682 [Conidiobolus coronatus NRRL 28638]|eukprot:KXN72460.1 hypothetical protein CONCODRAFT_4682 [Conidiobolus coronatus NRRL 28638]